MLKLMYVTNRPEIAQIAERNGVDWIFVDMEFIGKDARQGGLDTVKNHHTVKDVARIKQCITKAEILVRVNPIHEIMSDYFSSEDEINAAIGAGADIIMLPFFKTVQEVKKFITYVNGRAKTCLLLETPEAALLLDEIVEIEGIDMIHIGLNDLHLALGKKFMFELLADGIVDRLSAKIKAKGIPFGFGGIATLHGGLLSGVKVLREHYRLGSSMVIVSRSFCNTDQISDLAEVEHIFQTGISEIRAIEEEAANVIAYFSNNRMDVVNIVKEITTSKYQE